MFKELRRACRTTFVSFAYCVALAGSVFADANFERVQSPEAFSKVKLVPRPAPWDVRFVCYSKCDAAFSEKIRKAFDKEAQSFTIGSNQTPPPRYIVIYSGEYDAGEVMTRFDLSDLHALTSPYRTEKHIYVELNLSVDPKLPCQSVDYGVNGAGEVDFVVVDYLAYGKTFETYYEHPDLMIERCTKVSLQVFQRP